MNMRIIGYIYIHIYIYTGKIRYKSSKAEHKASLLNIRRGMKRNEDKESARQGRRRGCYSPSNAENARNYKIQTVTAIMLNKLVATTYCRKSLQNAGRVTR
jgi:hypothetical protein